MNYCHATLAVRRRMNMPVAFMCLLLILPLRLHSRCVDGNCRSGTGSFRYSNGDVYTGHFSKGRPHGSGSCRFAGGDTYSGRFENGMIHGTGAYRFAGGDTFTGTFENGSMRHGTYTLRNGERYTGWFFNGKKNGEGTYYYAGGYRYEGLWENDLKHGPGAVYRGKKTILRGIWKRGRFARKYHSYSGPSPAGGAKQ